MTRFYYLQHAAGLLLHLNDVSFRLVVWWVDESQ